jgi:hypothetical protein
VATTPPPLPAAAPQVGYGFGPPPPYAAPAAELTDGESRVAVNATGIVLEVGGAAADFAWAEIAGAWRTWRGHHLTVAVRLWDGGVYDCELNARRSARLGEWLARLDPVLGRYLRR